MTDEPHVRVTNALMYQKLMDINENQIRMMAELQNLSSIPDRVRSVESRLDRLYWVERVAYTGLGAAVIALTSFIFTLIGKTNG
jgi:hypothetical protein